MKVGPKLLLRPFLHFSYYLKLRRIVTEYSPTWEARPVVNYVLHFI